MNWGSVTVAVRSEAWVLAGWLLGSWVRIPLRTWMFIRVFLRCVVLYDWKNRNTNRKRGNKEINKKENVDKLKTSQYSVWMQIGLQGFDPQQRQRIFLVASASRPALGPSQPPIQWVPGGSFPPRVKSRPGSDVDHSPPSSAEIKN
jgi:hypothetical protein